MQDSIFTKILKGDIPGEVIYQDNQSFVLLTIQPMTPGHMLVVPRQQIDHLWDVDNETYHHLFDVAKQMQELLNEAFPNYERIALGVEGYGVPHAHIHVFGLEKPLEETTVDFIGRKKSASNAQISPDELSVVAQKLRAV
jgi:histidine triad (HIT) family protein